MAKQQVKKAEFDGVIVEERGGCSVDVPNDVLEIFGKNKRIKIKAQIDGEPYRGSIAPYGGRTFLLVLKSIREKIGKGGGDSVHVLLEEDPGERVVELPEDFKAALKKNPSAKKIYEGQAYTYQRECVGWITGAKRAETRASRIERAVEMLALGLKVGGSAPKKKN